MQDPDSGTSLRSDGSNAASVLQEIERRSADDLNRICELLETIVPQTTKVQSKKHGNKLSLEFTQEWTKSKKVKFESFSMSDGTLHALGLLTAVYQFPGLRCSSSKNRRRRRIRGHWAHLGLAATRRASYAGSGDHPQPRTARCHVDRGSKLENCVLARRCDSDHRCIRIDQEGTARASRWGPGSCCGPTL